MLHTISQNEKTEYFIFDSLMDLVADAKAVPEKRVGTHDQTNNESFTGRTFKSWDDVYAATTQPWHHGITVLDRMMKDLDDAHLPKPVSRKRKPRFDEADGDELDYDRMRCGQPFWRKTQRQNAKGPATITIIVNMSANFRVKHEDILWRGAAAITLTKMLEEAGYRVELWATAKSNDVWATNSKSGFDIAAMPAVRLKAPSDPMDCSTLISAVSGWCFRTLIFREYCRGKHKIAGNLGHSLAPNSQDLDQISRDANRILIEGVWDHAAAVQMIRDTLAKVAK
jgi:hypothetical protein